MTAVAEAPICRLLTVAEAAAVLGTGRDYVYERIKAGELPVVELGTAARAKTRVSSAALDRFIDSRTHVADPGEAA
ncbi:helix-turn-helix domain-containing protein [Arthrobacter woluwensis]|uniref:helix-turn-helix domain-containing protein n=1 Tax=Arthrobacter woluwensis TaxID=156980 RepID=UPI001AAFA480|nr:helix-turn-helix domain-containing protein [Arthrobacter woluwensis]QTF70585.1 helix-turn-helix domain-containing protein [Arthrobacter woluwensis]